MQRNWAQQIWEIVLTSSAAEFVFHVLSSFGLCAPETIRNIWRDSSAEKIDLAFEEELAKQLRSASRLIFVLGEWGTGKTFQIFCFAKKSGKAVRLRYRSFFGIKTLDHAYLTTLPRRVRLLATLLFFTVGAYAWHLWGPDLKMSATTIGILSASAGVGFSYLVLSNRFHFFYIGSNILYQMGLWCFDFPWNKINLIVLDDLDRSCLPDSERWALLSDLWLPNHKYIIPFGHMNAEDRRKLLEIAKKLNGAIIYRHAREPEKIRLCRELWADFPINEASRGQTIWSALFTPRDFCSLIDRTLCVTDGSLSTLGKQLFFLRLAFLHLRNWGVESDCTVPDEFLMLSSGPNPTIQHQAWTVSREGQPAYSASHVLLSSIVPEVRRSLLEISKHDPELVRQLTRPVSDLEFISYLRASPPEIRDELVITDSEPVVPVDEL